MKDIEKLLRMTERPQDYSDEEIQQMMSDPDMRAYYELMVDAEAGFVYKRGKKKPIPMIFKMAAMFLGLLLLSGIAFAAYHYAFGNGERADVPVQEAHITNIDQKNLQQETAPNNVRTFENAELQQILQELSEYYHVGVVFQNENSRHIRLYTKWDTTTPLHLIIERLNGFEKVSVHLTDNQIIAE